MNRHQRRAQAATRPSIDLAKMAEGLGSLQEFALVAEQLRPMLEEAQKLAVKLQDAQELLEKASVENDNLRKELTIQRQVFTHLIAKVSQQSFTGERPLSGGEVLSMEQTLREEFLDGNSTIG